VPELSPAFKQVEDLYLELVTRYQSGDISTTLYENEFGKLVVRDEVTGVWKHGPGSGQWLWFDGQNWVQRDPPSMTPVSQTSSGKPIWPWILLGTIVLLVAATLLILAFWILAS
jgi:hypothetical protein